MASVKDVHAGTSVVVRTLVQRVVEPVRQSQPYVVIITETQHMLQIATAQRRRDLTGQLKPTAS